MAQIVAVVSHKGGVGKTTTAQALAAGIAAAGFKVLAVDMDSQRNLSFCLGAQQGKTVLAVLTGDIKAVEAIQRLGTIDLIPAHKGLDALLGVLVDTGKEYRLKEALEPLGITYDYIIIDTPPSLGILTINALTAANSVIIPAQADYFSYQGMKQLIDIYTTVKKYTNKGLNITGILLTRYNGRTKLSKEMLEQFKEYAAQIGTRVFNTKIRDSTAVKEAQILRRDLFEYAPKCNAAKDYQALLDELMGE